LVLASTGAAVGIGNIWRFSYVAGQNGGGAFLVVYISCVLIIGIPLLIAELALGRRGQGDAVAAFAAVAPRSPWVMAGGLGVLAASLVLAYYAVIAGRVLKYLAGALLGTLWQTAGEGNDVFFARFIADRWSRRLAAGDYGSDRGDRHRRSPGRDRARPPRADADARVDRPRPRRLQPVAARRGRRRALSLRAGLERPDIALGLSRRLGQAFFSIGIGMALTSMISPLEVSVAVAIRVLGLPRWSATIALGLLIFAAGIPTAAGSGPLAALRWDGRGILDGMDHVVSNIMLPISGLLTAFFVGWRWREAPAEAGFGGRWLGSIWLWLVRWVAPALILTICCVRSV
jgi:SNF family Na+-dependent transporter